MGIRVGKAQLHRQGDIPRDGNPAGMDPSWERFGSSPALGHAAGGNEGMNLEGSQDLPGCGILEDQGVMMAGEPDKDCWR